jgi:hypothetical protein
MCLNSKPTRTTLWGRPVTVPPNQNGAYLCPAPGCSLELSKGGLGNHIIRKHSKPPTEEGSAPESSARGRAESLRRGNHPYSDAGRSRSRTYASSPLARSTSPLERSTSPPELEIEPEPEIDANLEAGVASESMQWEATAQHTSAVPSGRTVNTETVPVSIEQSELLGDFDLVVLQPYGLLACVICGWGFGHDHASGHLSGTHHNWGLKKEIVKGLADKYKLRTMAELVECKPRGIIPTLPILKTVNGFACSGCDFVAASQDWMNNHMRLHHPNPKVSVFAEAAFLQTFLFPRHGGYIHVRPIVVEALKLTSDLVNEAIAADQETYEPALIDNDWRAIHPFLEISGWGRWIGRMKRSELEEMRSQLKAPKELIEDCRSLIETTWKCCTGENYVARCHINSSTCVHRRVK